MHTSGDIDASSRDTPPSSGIADGAHYRLDPRVMQLERITGFIATACVSGFVAFAILFTWIAADSLWIPALVAISWPLVTGLLAWHSYRWPEISYRHESYRVDDLGIEIRRGVVWRREISVPRSRVQHIDVSQGPLERRFGLGSLSIYTAGTDYAMVALRGLTHARALLIRDHLLPRETQDAV